MHQSLIAAAIIGGLWALLVWLTSGFLVSIADIKIRRIYFTTTRQTIQNDLAHAIELLKSLPTEEEREKAAVYMDGLAQMRSDWAGKEKRPAKREVRARPAKVPKKP